MNRIFTAGLAVLIGLSMLSVQALAQERKQPPPQSKNESTPEPALAVVNNPTPSYLSGEVNVTVRGDENPIIRLQMVPNGQTLVEFPVKDRIFKVNPADPDLVTIEDSPTKETDRYILLRSSKQFLPILPNSQSLSAATSMIVQMTSGMVITLLIHPTQEFGHVVHRCVVRYDREAIVKARQAAGLAVNLDQREENATTKSPLSVQIAPVPKTTPENIVPSTPVSQSTQNAGSPLSGPSASAIDSDRPVAVDTKAPPSTPKLIIRATETRASKEGNEGLAQWDKKAKWSNPLHGLKVAAQTRVVNADRRQVLVSVQNILPTPVNIASQPELSIQTLDDRDRVLQVEPIKPLDVEVSNAEGLVAPGATAAYLITYETPVLGAKQRLCVAVAQSAAADDPVVIELTKGAR